MIYVYGIFAAIMFICTIVNMFFTFDSIDKDRSIGKMLYHLICAFFTCSVFILDMYHFVVSIIKAN